MPNVTKNGYCKNVEGSGRFVNSRLLKILTYAMSTKIPRALASKCPLLLHGFVYNYGFTDCMGNSVNHDNFWLLSMPVDLDLHLSWKKKHILVIHCQLSHVMFAGGQTVMRYFIRVCTVS